MSVKRHITVIERVSVLFKENKMKKKLLVLMLGLAMIFALAACSGGSEPAEGDTEQTQEETAETEESTEEADLSQPVIDKDAKTVTVAAQVNGTFFDQPTMHYVVFQDGGVGDKCMLPSPCDSQDFYDAMMEIGGEPWCTTTDKIEAGEFTDGQKVDVTLTWDGQEEPVEMVDSVRSDEGAFDIDMRFSGNKDNNAECGSGCIACLNSCWAGITSNAAYGYDTIDSGQRTAYLNDAVMPEDGTTVYVTFTLK